MAQIFAIQVTQGTVYWLLAGLGLRGQLIREAAVCMHHQALSVCLSIVKTPTIDEAMNVLLIG